MNPKTLHSRDESTYWNDALQWLRNEAGRFGYATAKVTETGARITGRLYKIEAVIQELNDTRSIVRIDKSTRMNFEIRDFDGYGSPSIMVSRFGKDYRVYHEHIYDAAPVYPLGRLFAAGSLNQADACAWTPPPAENTCTLSTFDWWRAFLREETGLHEENEIGKLLNAL